MTLTWEYRSADDFWVANVDGNYVGRVDGAGTFMGEPIYSGQVDVWGRGGSHLRASYLSGSPTGAMLWLGRAYVQLTEALKELAPVDEAG